MNAPPALERAYQLARAGGMTGIGQIKKQLRAEGYRNLESLLFGRGLLMDLRRICQAAGKAKSERQ